MATSRGRSEVKAYFADVRAGLEQKLLPGAARAGAKVVAAEVKDRSLSSEVADNVVITRPKKDGDQIKIRITIRDGWAYSLGVWQEWGTSQHFISVDDSQRQGMSVRKVNEAHKGGSMIIGGQFVGATVLHPGAQAHPFMRVSLDLKQEEAVAAAQSFINSHIKGGKIVAPVLETDEK